MSILFPVVNIGALGLPALLSHGQSLRGTAALLTDDVLTSLTSIPIQWGLFLNGELALNITSVIGVEPHQEYRLPTYPIEQGNFETYNKVTMPQDIHLQVTKSGTESERTDFLAALDQIAASLELYDMVTPEYVFLNVNIARVSYRRTAAQGATLLTVELALQEIRSNAQSQFSNTTTPTAQPAGAPQNNAGVVQSATVPNVAVSTANQLDVDNLPGFSQPGLKYSALGFQ